VSFSDGSPLTARDVKRHFERLLDPGVKSPDAWILQEVEGAAAFVAGGSREVRGIEVLDEQTLEVRLETPKAFFLHLVTLPAMAVAKLDGRGEALGTGPFRLARLGTDRIELERNPGYYEPGLPLLDRLEMQLLPSRAAAIEALRAGRLDVVTYLYAEHVEAPGLEGHQVVASTTPSTWFLAFNLKDPTFQDPRVRQGLRAGLDLESAVTRFHSGARPARTLTPPQLLGEAGVAVAPRPDVAQAERLLREAGVRTLRLTLHYPTGRDTTAEDAVLFAPLVDAGLVELTHVELPAEEYRQRERGGRVGLYRAGWIADYLDADSFLYFLLHSSAQTVYPLGYHNAELDQLLSEARVSVDPELRYQLYRRAEKLLSVDCPVIPLYHERLYALTTAATQGMRLHQTPPQVRFESLWLDPEVD
jgi:ABC-type oligopeptide transport system substrate-binding subunit